MWYGKNDDNEETESQRIARLVREQLARELRQEPTSMTQALGAKWDRDAEDHS